MSIFSLSHFYKSSNIVPYSQPQQFGEYIVTLTAVSPVKDEETVPDSSYRFTFTIEKK